MLICIPNTLTITRIAIIPLVVICIFLNTNISNITGALLFAIASLTDFLDGYLARTWKVTTKFGQFLDPIADKLLVLTSLFALVGIGRINKLQIIPTFIIICREFLVSGLREFLADAKISLPVIKLAKWKTALQLFAIGSLILHESAPWEIPCYHIGVIGLWAASILTLGTSWVYFKRGYKYIKEEYK